MQNHRGIRLYHIQFLTNFDVVLKNKEETFIQQFLKIKKTLC